MVDEDETLTEDDNEYGVMSSGLVEKQTEGVVNDPPSQSYCSSI